MHLRWIKQKGQDRLKLEIGILNSLGVIDWAFVPISFEDPEERIPFLKMMRKRNVIEKSTYRKKVKKGFSGKEILVERVKKLG